MGIRKEFWQLAWPAAAEGLLLMMLTAADLLMVSSLGAAAVAAVSIFSQPRMVILCFPRSFSVALSYEIMLFVAAVNIPEAWAMIHAGLLRGLGRTGVVAVYSLISIAVVRPILTVLLVYTFGLGLHGAWIALTVDQTTRAVCSMLGVRRVFPVRAKS